MIANTEQLLVQKFRVLPEEKQARVLEFVEELEAKNENSNGDKTEESSKIEERRKARMSLAGIGKSRTGDISERVDEILAEGINKEEGWSLP